MTEPARRVSDFEDPERDRQIETRYRPGTVIEVSLETMQQAGLDVHWLQGTIFHLRAELAAARQERDDARTYALYHSDCRPNRRQAEAWRADAKAMNDRWADEVKARREAETALAALQAQLRALRSGLKQLSNPKTMCEAPSDAYDIPCECCRRVASTVAALLDPPASQEPT